MGFIHGELSWSDGQDVVTERVRSMLQPLSSYPWVQSGLVGMRTERSTCVLAAQQSPGDRWLGLESCDTTRLAIAGDLRFGAPTPAGSSGADERATDAMQTLQAYRDEGLECASKIWGDGTFAIWDGRNQRLVCWRDVAGTRPLYYRHAPGRGAVFSSDLRALSAHPLVPVRFDLGMLRSRLEIDIEFHHPERTLCDGILKVPAAHLLVVDRSGARVLRYWSGEDVPTRSRVRVEEHLEELRELVSRAVSDRLVDQPHRVGAHLSGGLDSSSITVLGHRSLAAEGRRLHAASWAPPLSIVGEIEHDERRLVRAVAEQEGLDVAFTTLNDEDLVEILTRDDCLRPATTLHVEMSTSRAWATEQVVQVFSGWGGDEVAVFNGRGYFAQLALRGRWLRMLSEMRQRNEIHRGSTLGMIKGRVVLPLLPDWVTRLGRNRSAPATISDAVRPELLAEVARAELVPGADLRERAGVRRMQRVLLNGGHLQYRMESWAGHGAELGITYSFPLLDRRVIEFALSAPEDLYFREGWKRWLYRSAMNGVLPDPIRWNTHKFDMALSIQLKDVRRRIGHRLVERLRERSESPLVDVERLIEPSRSNAPSAFWLAFTDVQP